MSDKFYVGRDLIFFTDNGKYKPISRITLKLDDENVVTAGDDTGMELAADCPFATQEMADAILAQYKGYQYQSYEAGAVNIDPSAELGDGLTADGHYSVISRTYDDGSGYPTLSAPGEAEMEEEYPSPGPMTQEFNRKIAKTYSLISKTAEEIRLEVKGVDEKYTALSVTLDGVAVTTTNADGTKTITLKDGIVTADAIAAGAITADKLAVGAITVGVLPDSVVTENDGISRLTNDSGYQTALGVVSIVNGTVTADYIYALGIEATSIRGSEIAIKGDDGETYGTLYAGTNSVGTTALELSGLHGLRLMSDHNLFLSAGGVATLTMQSSGQVTAGGVWDFSGASVIW